MSIDLKHVIDNFDTALYVFDIEELKRRIDFLRENLDKKIQLAFAIKANTFILKDVEPFVDKFEVCSPGELEICRYAQVPEEKIVVSGVHKEYDVMEKAIKNNPNIGTYTIESVRHMEILAELSHKYERRIEVIIRLASGSQFGCCEEEVLEMIEKYRDDEFVYVKGVQYFSGTQKTSIKKLTREVNYVDEFIQKVENELNYNIEELEFGPGFPVYYFKESGFDEAGFIKEFSDLIMGIKSDVKVILELGRSIAASCGTYITKVVDIKSNHDQNYAIVDGGIHQLVYYGQFMATKIPDMEIYPPRNNGEELKYNICGSLCTTNDILLKQLPVRDLKLDDCLVFKNTGAYCWCEGMGLFLSRDLPKVIIHDLDGQYRVVRERIQTYEFNKAN